MKKILIAAIATIVSFNAYAQPTSVSEIKDHLADIVAKGIVCQINPKKDEVKNLIMALNMIDPVAIKETGFMDKIKVRGAKRIIDVIESNMVHGFCDRFK